MWIVRIALDRPYSLIVLAVLILVLSPVMIIRTPTDIFPNINIPVVAVGWQYCGLNPEELEGRLTSVYERVLTAVVDNVEHIESTTIAGQAMVKIFLQSGSSPSRPGIINVASTAGFQPMPYAALYGATKSFLISFSMALQEELRNQGVSVVTLCPGQIRANSPEPKNGFRKSGFLYQSPERVVHAALETLAGGGGTVIPGFLNKFSAFVQRLLPRRIVPKLVAKMSRP